MPAVIAMNARQRERQPPHACGGAVLNCLVRWGAWRGRMAIFDRIAP